MSSTTDSNLMALRCRACNYTSPPPMPICPSCGGEELSECKLSGKGKVYTYTIVQMGFGTMAARVPYVLAIAELDEGMKLTTVLKDGTDLQSIQVGDAIEFSHIEEGVGPIFAKV